MRCFDTHNTTNNPLLTDTSLSNRADRQWVWMRCNEPFGWWQAGAPEGQPTLVSRLIDVEWWVRQCGVYFPTGSNGETYGMAKGRSASHVNDYTNGWNIGNMTRLLYVNGELDPWREASVSADFRPGGPLVNTAQVPVFAVRGGFHVSDLDMENGRYNAGVRTAQDQVVKQLAAWVKEWPIKQHTAPVRKSKASRTQMLLPLLIPSLCVAITYGFMNGCC